MPLVKSLLRKLINEEVDKLVEQASALARNMEYLKKMENRIKADPHYWKAACQHSRKRRHERCHSIRKRLKTILKKGLPYALDNYSIAFKILHPDSQKELLDLRAKVTGKEAGSGAGPAKSTAAAAKKTSAEKYYAQTEEGKCEEFGGTWNLLADKCIMPPSAKGKGATAGKDVAKRKPRKPNKTMAYLQSMLYYTLVAAGVKKPYFMGKKQFGPGYAPGADGIYGGKTQGAIDALRKTDKNAPKRQGSFKKSVRALVDYLKGAGKGTAAGKAKPQGAAKAPGLDLAKTIDSFSMKHGGGVFGKWIKAARKKGVSDEKIMNTIKGATANNTAWRAAYKNLKALSGSVDESKSPLKPLAMKDTMESFREHLNEGEVEEAMPGVPTKVEREEYKRETAGSADFVDTGDLRNALGENFNDLQIVDPASYPDVMAFTNSTSNDKLLPLKRTEDGTIYFKINDYGGGSYMKIKI